MTEPVDRLLREKEVIERCGFSHATLWRRVSDKTFPKPVKVSVKMTRWRESEVSAYMRDLTSLSEAA